MRFAYRAGRWQRGDPPLDALTTKNFASFTDDFPPPGLGKPAWPRQLPKAGTYSLYIGRLTC